MDNTANRICRCVVSLLEKHGVKHAVVSPGSRNAPLLIALSRKPEIKTYNIVDERSAAFIALGLSIAEGCPVALVCTSGTALLNYAPAVAEAFYRKVPLIVVSADRPKEWIGQDDSQTIRQDGALVNIVKRCYDIEASDRESDLWYANRVANDALITAVTGRIGPVHLNIRIQEPLGLLADDTEDDNDALLSRTVKLIRPDSVANRNDLANLVKSIILPEKVMIVAGFSNPDRKLNEALTCMSRMPNVTVLTETIANLHGEYFIDSIDTTLASIRDEDVDAMRPDVVITTGGALVSRHIKQFLRSSRLKAHWHVGENEDTVDCFRQLSTRIEMEPGIFFSQLVAAMTETPPALSTECDWEESSDYGRRWETARRRALSLTTSYVHRSEWSDLKAFATIIPMIPRRWNVHFSNGTSIRYAQIFGSHSYHRCDCNRGVSGIDGTTSTAVGASMGYTEDVTLLVSGDMSATYDISGLTNNYLSPRFKMIVIDNGGGGIFRFIGSTSKLDMREEMFCCPSKQSIGTVGEALGFKVFAASDETSLRAEFKAFAEECERPAMLVVCTPAEQSAIVLTDFFKFCKTH